MTLLLLIWVYDICIYAHKRQIFFTFHHSLLLHQSVHTYENTARNDKKKHKKCQIKDVFSLLLICVYNMYIYG
jgi:hypothetical protein